MKRSKKTQTMIRSLNKLFRNWFFLKHQASITEVICIDCQKRCHIQEWRGVVLPFTDLAPTNPQHRDTVYAVFCQPCSQKPYTPEQLRHRFYRITAQFVKTCPEIFQHSKRDRYPSNVIEIATIQKKSKTSSKPHVHA